LSRRREHFVLALALALGCGRSIGETGANGGPDAGAAGTGAAGAPSGGAGAVSGGEVGEGGRPDAPNHDDLIVRSSRMSAYEGLGVFATFDFNFGPGSRSDARADVVSNGSFELVWEQEFDRNSFGAYVVLFADRGNDATCTTDVDPAWITFANTSSSPSGEPIIVDFDPEADDPNFGPFSCDDFNTWFDEPFRPPP
jgi:hypothetical protein